ncbi:hypothetical protein [Streptomyces sp. 769]|uniref:hypothetical protein n=1 Tax=Streptomyces sp. 769 TaxID=1262452 RepID=UPI000581E6B1|nr:hypothetical protein [Streptomyces sp. 769]AJC54000.1 hypothetical protein GZL_01400 [Streptomyces sp. 769]
MHVLIEALTAKGGRSLLLMKMDKATEWNVETHLLATIADRIAEGNFYFIKANSGESDDLEFPEPIPRPGVEPVKPKQQFASGQELAGFFQQMSNL